MVAARAATRRHPPRRSLPEMDLEGQYGAFHRAHQGLPRAEELRHPYPHDDRPHRGLRHHAGIRRFGRSRGSDSLRRSGGREQIRTRIRIRHQYAPRDDRHRGGSRHSRNLQVAHSGSALHPGSATHEYGGDPRHCPHPGLGMRIGDMLRLHRNPPLPSLQLRRDGVIRDALGGAARHLLRHLQPPLQLDHRLDAALLQGKEAAVGCVGQRRPDSGRHPLPIPVDVWRRVSGDDETHQRQPRRHTQRRTAGGAAERYDTFPLGAGPAAGA